MADSNARKSPAKDPTTPATTPGLHPRRKVAKSPLWLHSGTGQWAKKIRGRMYYFGKDRDAALKEYLRVRDDLEAGRIPSPPDANKLTLVALCNKFLTHKRHQAELGEITQRSFADYYSLCESVLKHFGKTVLVEQLRPDDLMAFRRKAGKDKSPHTVGNLVQRTRVLLRFAFEQGLVDRPVRFGEFKRPSKSAFRRSRAAKGDRMIEAADLRRIIDAADVQLRAMVLLGLNAGFGNADCGQLPIKAVDLDGGWITFPRPKTGVPRRVPLWPETVLAIKAVMAARKPPKDAKHADLLFITKYGGPWHVEGKATLRRKAGADDADEGDIEPSVGKVKVTIGSARSAVSAEFRKLLVRLRLYAPGRSFYALRHTFQTIADELGDYLATRRVMGHADPTISDHYRERFPDARLQRVVDHVRAWLYGEGSNDGR